MILRRTAQRVATLPSWIPCWSGPRWYSVSLIRWARFQSSLPLRCVNPAIPHIYGIIPVPSTRNNIFHTADGFVNDYNISSSKEFQHEPYFLELPPANCAICLHTVPPFSRHSPLPKSYQPFVAFRRLISENQNEALALRFRHSRLGHGSCFMRSEERRVGKEWRYRSGP